MTVCSIIHTWVRDWATERWVRPFWEPQVMSCSTLTSVPEGEVRGWIWEQDRPPHTHKLVLPPEQKCAVFPRNAMGGREVRAKESGTASAD